MDVKQELVDGVNEINKSISAVIPQNFLDMIFHNIVSIIFALLIFFIGKFIAKKLSKIALQIFKKSGFESTLSNFLTNIVYYTLLIVVILATLNKLGVETTSFIAILGAAGLAVGLALKDSLKNFASGVMIILFEPFKAGDNITAAGVSGVVVEVNIFNTVFISPDNQKIIVPNSSITSGTIVNLTANNTRRIDVPVSVGYNDNIQKVREVLNDIASKNEKILKDKPVGVNVVNLADFSVDITFSVWVNSSDFATTRAWLLENIKNRFDEDGITIPYPIQEIYQHKKD